MWVSVFCLHNHPLDFLKTQDFIDDGIEELPERLAGIAAQRFSVIEQIEIDRLKGILASEASNFIGKMRDKRESEFTSQFMDTIALLDKSELAFLAESLGLASSICF